MTYLPANMRDEVAVFKGVFDFLSALEYYKTDKSRANVLVLNSVSMTDRAVQRLTDYQVQKLYAYLDNDIAGKEAMDKFQQGAWNVCDMSGLYREYKDMAELLEDRRRRGRGNNEPER